MVRLNDGIIKGKGNSRYLKSVANFLELYPSYEDFAAALIAGELPVDFNGINEEGWGQIGTPLNKANLLSDETSAMIEGSPQTPDEAFQAIHSETDAELKKKVNKSTYEFFMLGRIWGN